MLKNLYDKCIKLASHRYAKAFLAFFSFIESSIFPIPPDVMIVPMVIAKKKIFKIFFIATIFSTLGGLLGYFIGAFFLEISMKVIEFYGYEEKVIYVKNNLSSSEGILLWLATLFLAGFTPLPFKVFTITSGIISFNVFIFFIICLISRGLRFFIVAYLSLKFGNTFEYFLKKEGTKWFTIVGIIIVIIAVIIYFIFR